MGLLHQEKCGLTFGQYWLLISFSSLQQLSALLSVFNFKLFG
jgi:hypothetical protein